MRLRLFFVAILVVGCLLPEAGFTQVKTMKTQEFHLKRAKRDRTIGIIAGAASAAAIVTGIIYENKPGEGIGETLGNGNIAAFSYGSGLTFGLTSIGFFIGSGHHRRQAASIQPIVYVDQMVMQPMGVRRGLRSVHSGVVIHF